MIRPVRTALAALALASAAGTAHAIAFDFTGGAQGWTGTGAAVSSWVPALGNPGGFFSLIDSTSASAPPMTASVSFASALDRSAFFGGTLSFDFRYASPGPAFPVTNPGAGTVTLVGPSGTEVSANFFSTPSPTPNASFGGSWQTFSRTLDGATFGTSDAAFQSVLAGLTGVRIVVDPRMSGAFSRVEAVGLDNVVMAAVPEAHEWAMMLAGLGLVGWMVKRRRAPSGSAPFAAA
jgi:hypothetical protein